MSTLKTNTLTGTTSAGSIVVTGEGGSTTTNLQQGLAKMWGSFDQRGSTLGSVTSGDTFNVTSITDALEGHIDVAIANDMACLLYTSPSPRDATLSRMPSSA